MPRVSPQLKAATLPSAFVAIGGEDDLIDHAEQLRAGFLLADKAHEYPVYPDMPHAFVQMEFLLSAITCVREMIQFLQKMVPKI